ncbi:hypothetical protein EVAR_61411_1 [Eumeta japonica]|uniref:Uncharacterized protein n=1 Tax=Eumeta variegata TaxID=151549 RepID=A0A4C1YX68_EUMVA|nr:hypothetical protein EVAR_61411_1 [Eumeta japonica]
MKDASERFFDIASSHPNPLLVSAVSYEPPPPHHFCRRPRNVLIDPPDELTVETRADGISMSKDRVEDEGVIAFSLRHCRVKLFRRPLRRHNIRCDEITLDAMSAKLSVLALIYCGRFWMRRYVVRHGQVGHSVQLGCRTKKTGLTGEKKKTFAVYKRKVVASLLYFVNGKLKSNLPADACGAALSWYQRRCRINDIGHLPHRADNTVGPQTFTYHSE